MADALGGELRKQCAAVPGPAVRGAHKQILQVNAVHAVPGGERAEPQSEPNDLLALLTRLGDVAEQRRSRTEQRGAQGGGRQVALAGRLLVRGELVHHLDYRLDVGLDDPSHAHPELGTARVLNLGHPASVSRPQGSVHVRDQ